jgi:Ca-activated chloride channel homolog
MLLRIKHNRFGLQLLLFALIIPTFCSMFTNTFSQEEQERRRKTKPDLESTVSQDKGFKIGVNVDLVDMYTSVFDMNNQFVSGLKQNNFKLFEDGIQQSIVSFSQEDVPVNMGILLDLSLSMKNKIEQVNIAALAFVNASNPQDQVFLIGFSNEVELLQDYTNDIDEIKDALENSAVIGGTVLYDAIYLGIQKAHTGSMPKKAIVVITDGHDMDSFYKLDEVVAKVQEMDVQVFCIGFLEEAVKKSLWGKSESEKFHDILVRISEETGGKAFFPSKLTDMNSIVAEIASELRSQYSIGYLSSNITRDGTFRRVKIELNPANANRHLRYRRGYYAPKSSQN